MTNSKGLCYFSYFRTTGPTTSPNCRLSDIYQRDLLPSIDFVHDTDWWLFAWDNYNPECIALAQEPIHNNHIGLDNRITDRYGELK